MSRSQPQALINLCTNADKVGNFQVNPAVVARVRHLAPADQHLLHLAMSGRNSYRQIAALVMSNPGSVCRRVNTLTRRLSHPVVVALVDFPTGLSPEYQQVGIRRFLWGQSMRQIAREMSLADKEVRAILAYLPRWYQGVRSAQESQASHMENNRGENHGNEMCSAAG
jgi:hypothetical protein